MKEKSEHQEQERLGKAQDKENFYSSLPFNISHIISEEGSDSIYVSEVVGNDKKTLASLHRWVAALWTQVVVIACPRPVASPGTDKFQQKEWSWERYLTPSHGAFRNWKLLREGWSVLSMSRHWQFECIPMEAHTSKKAQIENWNW